MKTNFLIDGFNLYHSLNDASKDFGLNGKGIKWLDIKMLCESYLHLVDKNAQINNIYYFTALANYLIRFKPLKVEKHKKYIKALNSTGVIDCRGNFKKKTVSYKNHAVDLKFFSHEEKETDVAISIKILENFIKNECDVQVIITGDTDIAPAIRLAKELFTNKLLIAGFPYKRKNKELAKLVDKSFSISKEQYLKYQLPHIINVNNKNITKPENW